MTLSQTSNLPIVTTTVGAGVPTDAVYTQTNPTTSVVGETPADGTTYADTVSQIVFTRINGVWQPSPAIAFEHPADIYPGALGRTFGPEAAVVDQAAAISTGVLLLCGIAVVPGTKLTNANWLIGATAGASLTHAWSVLATGTAAGTTLKVVAVTADDTSGAITASLPYTKAFGTAYVVPASVSFLYLGLMVAGTTMPSLVSETITPALTNGIVGFASCVSVGPSSTAQTTPPALAASLTSISALTNTKLPMGWVS